MVNKIDMSKKNIVITGATGKLGQSISTTLGDLGANLILIDKSKLKLKKTKALLNKLNIKNVYTISCDFEIEKNRISMIKELHRNFKFVNCLINNAAFTGDSNIPGWNTSFIKQSLVSWRRCFEVNLTSVFHLSRDLYGLLIKAENPNIINISSIYGELGPDWSLYKNTKMANPAAYASSKGGLIQLTRWLSTTLAPNIRVNAISPGGIKRLQPNSFINKYKKRTPLKRMATEEDICGAIIYFTSDLSKYVTGQVLRVDGGWGSW